MQHLIKRINEACYKVYLHNKENWKKIKEDLGIKPFIFKVLESPKENFNIWFVNIIEKKWTYNKNVVESWNKLLRNLDKYNIDLFWLSKNWVLWWEFLHSIIPTKKNNKQIYLSTKWRNYIKSIYCKIWVEQFIKKMFAMQTQWWGKTLFIDSTERFKKIEARLTEGLFNLSAIPNIYYFDKETNQLYFTTRKTSMVVLLNLLWIEYDVKDIKPVWILKKEKIQKIFKWYLLKLYWVDAWKRIEVIGSFLNAYSNLKDISNMIEWPNDIFQDWLRKIWIPYDDQFIKRIITDDIISDKNLEGFWLYYKNMITNYDIRGEFNKILNV